MNAHKHIGFLKKYAFGFYWAFFLILFIQFPLAGSLPGCTDSMWYVSVFNDYASQLQSWMSGKDIGTVFYPDGSAAGSGEPSFGAGGIFLFFKLLGLDDLWAMFLLISLVYTSSAWGMFKFSRFYLKDDLAAFLAGGVFAASAFALGHIDDQKVFAFLFAFLSLHQFRLYIENGEQKHLIMTMVWGGIEVYFSSYCFIFQCILLGTLGLIHLKDLTRDPKKFMAILVWLPLMGVIILPFAWRYLVEGLIEKSYNPIDIIRDAQAVSLNLSDLLQASKHNLIYPTDYYENPGLIWSWHSAFTGFSFALLALLGIYHQKNFRWELIVFLIIGLILGFGPSVTVGDREIPMLMYPLYKYVKATSYLRIPIRAYFISLIALSIFAGAGLQYLVKRLDRKWIVFGAMLSVFLLENLSFPFEKYESKRLMEPPKGYYEYLAQFDSLQVMMDLPSLIFERKYQFNFNGPMREYAYVLWQTRHHHNSLNGSGYLTPRRLRNNDLTSALERPGNLHTLIAENGLDLLFFHKWCLLDDENASTLEVLKASPQLQLEMENDKFAVFKVKKEE